MRGALLIALALLSACDQNMVQQPRYDSYEANPLFADGKTMRHPPAGVVERSRLARIAATRQPPISSALLARGQDRYRIYCAPCHGRSGEGNGMVPQRGFPKPPSYFEPRLLDAPDAHFYDVITHGYGVMYSYADRVPPEDRWAIAAYIRLLQNTRAQGGGSDEAR